MHEQESQRTTIRCSSSLRIHSQHLKPLRSTPFRSFIVDHRSGTEVLAQGLIGTCAQINNHDNYSPPYLSDVPITHNFCSTGLSSRINCWSSSGLIKCSGVIQVASSTEKPFHNTKYSLIIFLFLLIFCYRKIFSISQYGSSTSGASSCETGWSSCTSAAFQSLNKET